MNIPIFIEYETKSREFDGKLLLITNLLQAGFTNICFGTNRYLRKLALKKSNGIYFFKSISKNEVPLYKELKKRGHKLVLLHAEGGIHYKDNESSIRSIFNPEVSRYFDVNFLFGGLIKDSIDKYGVGQKDQHMVVTGDPRFDLLKAKYDSFFEKDIKKISDKYGDFILINTSFSASNPQAGMEYLRKYWENEPTLTRQTKDLLMLKMDYFTGIIDDYLIAIKALASKFTQKTFVVRPHPSESLDIYLQHFKEYRNIHVTKEGNVAMWIKAAKGVIHYDCTTGIEALVAGKPVVAYVPKYDEKIVAWLPIAISKKITEQNDLISEIERIFAGKYEHQLDGKTSVVLEQTIHNVSSESSPLISDYLLNVHVASKYVDRSSIVLQLIDQFKYNLRIQTKKIILHAMGKIEVGNSKKGRFTKKEIDQKLKNLNSIQNISKKFTTKMLTIDAIAIKGS